MNTKTPFYILAAGVFILLKFYYTISDTKSLSFLLKPTNKAVELITGSKSINLQEKGYYFESLNIIIDKSCSGFNFWLICFLMLTFLSLKFYESTLQRIGLFIISIISAYLITVFVNSSRIIASIILQKQNISILGISEEYIHEGIGIVTNITFLICTYLIIQKILIKKTHHVEIT